MSSKIKVYQFRVYLRKISPIIWRRILVRSDSTIADFHHTLQIVMNWDDYHLHHFLIRSKRYGIAQIGAFGFMDDAYRVRSSRFNFRPKEKFVYTYNYYDDWQLEIRLEECLPLDFQKTYPLCIAGKRVAPLDDDGGPWRFMEFRQKYSIWEISPYAEHILDWFHVTMRITMMRQMARKFLELPGLSGLGSKLESVKWYLWHGNVFQALQHLRWIYMDLEVFEEDDIPHKKQFRRLYRAVDEFETYITLNEPFIPNYGERHRYGEPISTAFVESTVNEVISRRMVKKQQMRWTQKGAHLLLQVRTRALSDDLKDTFCRWYPGMASTSELPLAA